MSIFQAVETDLSDMSLAKEIGEILEGSYPGWLWAVKIKGGIVFIQSLVICEQLAGYVRYAQSLGMVVTLAKIITDAKVRKHEIIMKAGEFLERINQKRGAVTDDAQNIRRVELH